jgi:N-acetylglucosamine-6-phosphate deacetylase
VQQDQSGLNASFRGIYAYDAQLDDQRIVDQGWIDLEIREGMIRSVVASVGPNETAGWVAPGLIDLQINGGGGAYFTDTPDEQTLNQIAITHQKCGTTQWLPTVMSTDEATIMKAMQVVKTQLDRNGIIGIHIEGPFFAPTRAGAHEPAMIRPFQREEIKRWLADGYPPNRLLLTAAPEQIDPSDREWLRQVGIRWLAGHSDASAVIMNQALAAGCYGGTHLFNAMPAIQGRTPALTGALLTHSQAWCTIIADGAHVDPLNLTLAAQMKRERLLLISDAMSATGTNQSDFELQGRTICNDPISDRWTDARGVLAGACLPLYEMVRRMQRLTNVSRREALAMAGSRVAQFLELSDRHGRIAAGRQANLIFGFDDESLHSVIASGRWVKKYGKFV